MWFEACLISFCLIRFECGLIGFMIAFWFRVSFLMFLDVRWVVSRFVVYWILRDSRLDVCFDFGRVRCLFCLFGCGMIRARTCLNFDGIVFVCCFECALIRVLFLC